MNHTSVAVAIPLYPHQINHIDSIAVIKSYFRYNYNTYFEYVYDFFVFLLLHHPIFTDFIKTDEKSFEKHNI